MCNWMWLRGFWSPMLLCTSHQFINKMHLHIWMETSSYAVFNKMPTSSPYYAISLLCRGHTPTASILIFFWLCVSTSIHPFTYSFVFWLCCFYVERQIMYHRTSISCVSFFCCWVCVCEHHLFCRYVNMTAFLRRSMLPFFTGKSEQWKWGQKHVMIPNRGWQKAISHLYMYTTPYTRSKFFAFSALVNSFERVCGSKNIPYIFLKQMLSFK